MQQQIESIILSNVGNRLTQELAHGIILGVLQVAQQATMTQPQPCAPPSRRCRTSRCWTSRVPLARRRPPAAVRWIMWTPPTERRPRARRRLRRRRRGGPRPLQRRRRANERAF